MEMDAVEAADSCIDLSLDKAINGGEEDERPAVARAVLWLRGMLAKDALKMTDTATVS